MALWELRRSGESVGVFFILIGVLFIHGIITDCEQKRFIFAAALVFNLLPPGSLGIGRRGVDALQPGAG